MSEMDLSVLEETKQVDGEVMEDEEDEPQDEQIMADLQEAFDLIHRAKTMLDYISDPQLCKTISKRERETMTRLSGNLADYLNETAESYNEVEEGL